jgi:hypothetical protein
MNAIEGIFGTRIMVLIPFSMVAYLEAAVRFLAVVTEKESTNLLPLVRLRIKQFQTAKRVVTTCG